MKNKIILSIILTALGIALFTYVNNLQNAKNLYRFNYVSKDNFYKKSSDKSIFESNDLTKNKSRSKKFDANSVYGKKTSTVNPFSKSIVTINSTKDYNANTGATVFTNENVLAEKNKYRMSKGFNVMPFIASAKTGNSEYNSSAAYTYNNETSSSGNLGKQSAPITTLDGGGGSGGNTIIVDPGGDPTDPRIPIGDGKYVLLALVVLYLGYRVFFRKKKEEMM